MKHQPYNHLLIALVAWLFPATVSAQYAYTVNADNTTITITGMTSYNGWGGSVTIPDTIDGYVVTAIGASAFAGIAWGIENFQIVNLPNSITNIGPYAFYFSGLSVINLPDGLTTIGTCAFGEDGLTTVTIPQNATNIGTGILAGCPGLTHIEVAELNPSLTSIDGVLFDKSRTTLIQYPGGMAAAFYEVPNTVVKIGASAFYRCDNLRRVRMMNGVKVIGDSAFENCLSLAIVQMPASVSQIADGAFFRCENLTSITIPAGVTNLGTYAFADCFGLQNVFFQGNAPAGDRSVFGADNGTAYYLPGTTGWEAIFCGWPTALWNPQLQTADGSFGVSSNQFGFNINWASGQTVVVEASPDLVNWQPLQTNTLTTGSAYFSDPLWTNYPNRFYRVRSP